MKTQTPAESEEPAASLTGRARNDALHALRVLSEAADAGDETELPPLPEHIRDQWQEAYGQTAPSNPLPSSTSPPGWITRLAGLLKSPRFAWGSGLAAAAAVLIIIVQSPDQVTAPGGGSGPIVTRGGNHSTAAGTAEGLVVIGNAGPSAAIMSELARAFPSRSIERMDSVPANTTGTIIIDTAARAIRRGTVTIPLTDASPAAVIMAIESLDEPEPR